MEELFSINKPDRHYGCRVNDNVVWNGIHSIVMQNELLQILIHIDKGSEITQFLYKPLDLDFMWHNPHELHNPANFSTSAGDDTSPFFDHWSGGWFEAVPNAGPSSSYKGASLGFFAETVNMPWHYKIMQDDQDCVKVALWARTYRTPFILRKTLTLKSNVSALFIEEQLTNDSNEDMEFMWAHHPVLGSPFLDDTCQIDCADCKVNIWIDEDGPGYRLELNQESRWPYVKGVNGEKVDLRKVLGPESKTLDNVYLSDMEEPWISVTNQSKKIGFGFAFDPEMWKHLLLWQGYGGGTGYPWFHRTYQLAVEPWSSYQCAGLENAIQNKTARKLKAGQSVSTWLTAVVYPGEGQVSNISKDGKVKFNK